MLKPAVRRDPPSRKRSITTSDMCQAYYVRGFIERIYSVAVCLNQAEFMHTGSPLDSRGACIGMSLGIASH